MIEWFKLQKRLYSQIQRELHGLLAHQPKSLKNYATQYAKDFRLMRQSSQKQLFQSINESQILLVGDFHTLRQSQRMMIRLLRDKNLKPPQYLALEVLDAKFEDKVLNPSSKKLDEYRELLDLEQSFGSSFEVYKELFHVAHSKGIKLVGLKSSSKSLKTRDRSAAKIINKLDARTWVLFGEFHCARPHLPSELLKLNKDLSICILQQNPDKLHLKNLKEMSAAKRDLIFKSGSKHQAPMFAILHTPLWLKWQSFLDQHRRSQITLDPVDPHDQISWSIRTLVDFLKDRRYPQPVSLEELLDFNVFSVEDEDFMHTLQSLSRKDAEIVQAQLENSRVAITVDNKKIFLSEVTINSCAQAAGAYLFKSWAGIKDPFAHFYVNVLFESISFLLSKVLNHSRKTKHWKELGQLSRSQEQKQEIKRMLESQFFSQHFHDRKAWVNSLEPYRHQAAIALGRNLADWAFEAFLAGEFSKQRLIRMVLSVPRDELGLFERLIEIKSLGDTFNSRYRSFRSYANRPG